jgi:uncharacterized membrane protein YeaQ/YmgE (transglycosylase-associated protein family)
VGGVVAASTVGIVVAIMLSAFFTGALARLAVPGPDPMPAWLTVSIGLAGSIVGAVVGAATSGGNGFVTSFAAFGVAMLLVIGYRRFYQGRPAFGPEALRPPKRGIGIDRYRDRVRRAGLDPDKTLPEQLLDHQRAAAASAPQPGAADDAEANLRKLEELHRAGILSDDELTAKRALVLDR